MFCKWCGAQMPQSAAKCSRCGRDVPAKSDCGGFFDLAPTAKRPVVEELMPPQMEPKETPVPPAKPDKQEPPQKTPPKAKKNSGRKGSGLLLVLTLVGFVIVIALLIGINGKLADLDEKLDSVLSEREQNRETTAPGEDDPTTASTTETTTASTTETTAAPIVEATTAPTTETTVPTTETVAGDSTPAQ